MTSKNLATLAVLLASAFASVLAPGAQAQTRKDSAILGMILEPSPGLDPTTSSAASIGEIVHYNVLEGLTKINMDGTVVPLLAESWTIDPDGKSYTFHLKQGREIQRRRSLRCGRRQVQL
jgi:peptide/nickel transport system substrate-binding protein